VAALIGGTDQVVIAQEMIAAGIPTTYSSFFSDAVDYFSFSDDIA
jgi:hypothetical protein